MPILRDGPDDRLDILGAPGVVQGFIETLDTRFGSIISATETAVTVQTDTGEMTLSGGGFVFEETDNGFDVSGGTIHEIAVERHNQYSESFSMEELDLDWADMVAVVDGPGSLLDYFSSMHWDVYAGNKKDIGGGGFFSRAGDYFHGGLKVFLGAGRDEFVGGVARDVLYGGSGSDLLVGQRGNDKLVGQKGNDTLKGGAHRDLLKGGVGDDGLEGGGGNDRLVGGEGADRFIFGAKHGSDKIRDFELEVDLVYLSRKKVSFTLDDTEEGAVMSYGATTVLFSGIAAADLTEDHILY